MVLKLTNGAAQYSYNMVSTAKPAQEDWYVSGSIAIKTKKAKQCFPEEGDDNIRFVRRVAEWGDKEFGEIDFEDIEVEYLKTIMKELIREKKINQNEYGFELGKAIGFLSK